MSCAIRFRPFQAAAPRRVAATSTARRPRLAIYASATPAVNTSTTTLQTFLDDCAAHNLGKVRFIVMGDGAILESVSSFSRVKYTDVPGRGLLATVSTEDKTFECHVVLSKVKEVKLAKSKAKAGDYDVYATRFYGGDDGSKLLMTCILHGSPPGTYDPQAVEAWGQLHGKYGDSIKL